MGEHVIAAVEALGEGERITTQLEGREVTVFNVEGELRAYTNWCPHQSGPVCEGMVSGRQAASYDPESGEVSVSWGREGEIISCPWHGWEYDLTTGQCLAQDVRLPAHPVEVVDGEIVVSL